MLCSDNGPARPIGARVQLQGDQKVLARRLDVRTAAAGLLACGIITGLAVPSLTSLFAPYALGALFLVVVFSLLPFASLPGTELVTFDPAVLRTVLWQQVVLPCIVIAVGILAKFPDVVVSLMIVTACAGSLFASPALADLLNLDRRRALQCMVLSTFVMPFSLFFFLGMFHGVNIYLNVEEYVRRTAIFLATPFAIFLIYRFIASNLRASATMRVDAAARWAAVLSLLVFGIGIMHAVADELRAHPMKVLFFLVIATTLCIGMLVLTTVVMYRFGLNEALTGGIVSGFRNVGLGFALVGEMVGADLAVYVGVSMLPVFIAPVVIRLVSLTKPQFQYAVAG